MCKNNKELKIHKKKFNIMSRPSNTLNHSSKILPFSLDLDMLKNIKLFLNNLSNTNLEINFNLNNFTFNKYKLENNKNYNQLTFNINILHSKIEMIINCQCLINKKSFKDLRYYISKYQFFIRNFIIKCVIQFIIYFSFSVKLKIKY